MIWLTPIVSRTRNKWFKDQKVQKYALKSQLQALQILTNDDEVENWCLSSFLLAVCKIFYEGLFLSKYHLLEKLHKATAVFLGHKSKYNLCVVRIDLEITGSSSQCTVVDSTSRPQFLIPS